MYHGYLICKVETQNSPMGNELGFQSYKLAALYHAGPLQVGVAFLFPTISFHLFEYITFSIFIISYTLSYHSLY